MPVLVPSAAAANGGRSEVALYLPYASITPVMVRWPVTQNTSGKYLSRQGTPLRKYGIRLIKLYIPSKQCHFCLHDISCHGVMSCVFLELGANMLLSNPLK